MKKIVIRSTRILKVIGKIVSSLFPCCFVGIEIANVSIRVRDLILTPLMPSPIGLRVVVPTGVFFGISFSETKVLSTVFNPYGFILNTDHQTHYTGGEAASQ
jgi:hypothetical protein